MRIVIVGCGRVGAQLAQMLAAEGHGVTVVDRDPLAAQRLGRAFPFRFVQGVGFDRNTLLAAGIEEAQGFAAVTGGDNTNIVAALTARDHFHVERVVARIADPRRAEIYRQFGIPTISPTSWGATQIRDALCQRGLSSVITLGSGEVEILNVEIPAALDGKPASALLAAGDVQLVAIVRAGKAFIPGPDTLLAASDSVRVAVARSAVVGLTRLVGQAAD